MTSFLTDLQNSDVGRVLLREREQKERAARQKTVDELQALRRELVTTVERYDGPLATLQKAATFAKEKAKEADHKLLEKQHERLRAVNSLEHRATQLEGELRSTADPRIDAAKYALFKRWDATRAGALKTELVETGGFNPHTLKPLTKCRSNRRAIERVSAALGAARDRFDQLKFENPADLPAAIAAIEATIPWHSLSELEDHVD